ncbi:MAG: tyrosine--tRNA ligase [Candidatus Levybacteria bacterium]|nr:tyrosine--tRNA ligase [Candidatus Levybacteria bacterium]
MDKVEELLTRGVANIIPGKTELEQLLKSDKKINVYFGIDPTATKIHLGHAVPLRKLQKFAEMGHNVTFLIGDFTALIGDTSDKDSERPVLTPEQIEENFQTYKKQAEKILDFTKVKVRHNSDWLKKLTFEEIVKLSHAFSLNDFISRELIRKRLSENKNIGLAETQYPMMQGYDSYFLDTDLQIGGTDQTFNMQAGRTLQKKWRNKESFVLSTEFLMGTDGRKMSKTWGNAIWLDDEPNGMYAKVMSLNDDLIASYFLLATDLSMGAVKDIEEELKKDKNPMLAKKDLARQIVKELHGDSEAEKAEKNFERTVQKGELPENVPTVHIDNPEKPIDEILVETGLVPSKSEAKRVINQGGTFVEGTRIINPNEIFSVVAPASGATVSVGPIKFVKVRWDK